MDKKKAPQPMPLSLAGRGRHRPDRLNYVGVVLLTAVALVGFAIGSVGLGSGGLLSAATRRGGSSSPSFASQVKKYETLTKQRPTDEAAWEGLANNLLDQAGGGADTSAVGVLTSQGKTMLARAARAWSAYIALHPAKPNPHLAQLMVNVYGEAGLNEPRQAIQALRILAAAHPTAAYYSQLALDSYRAAEDRLGDLSSKKAITLAPKHQRARLKKELQEAKNNPSDQT